ncbi:MAG: hypothetical protein H6657_01885 [Ardenticatenaceae bacterium]|nr:hypothetical protein [Ardenticatenaceae bacterium]
MRFCRQRARQPDALFRRYDSKSTDSDAEIEALGLGLGDWLASLPNGLDAS